jgi:5-methylthioribose kinase
MFRRYAYGWLTLGFFLGSLILHWYFGWFAFAEEQQSHGQSPEFANYTNEMLRDTFENWQSEFLQLLWQVVGLAYFLYIGSPASKENDDRAELKLDAILRAIGGDKADELIARIDKEYERDTGHTPHAHGSDLAKNAGRELQAG